MRINDIVVLENNKRYILTNKYELDNNIYYLAYELLDNEKTDKFVFVKKPVLIKFYPQAHARIIVKMFRKTVALAE